MKNQNIIMNRKFNHGFTLIELLVTMAIAAILLALAVPSFKSFFSRNRVATVTNDYMSSINFARSEAVKGGAITTMCMMSTSSVNTCSTTNTGWSAGWIIWADRNSNSMMDAGELLRSHGPINAGNVAIGGTQIAFKFNGQGALTTTAGADTFNICTSNDLTLSNSITIGPSGQLRRAANPSLATCP